MRFARIIATAVALALLGFFPVAFTSSATAADRDSGFSAKKESTEVAQQAKRRTVTINFRGGSGSFRLVGNVKPRGAKKKVVLVRAGSRNGTYRNFRTGQTNRQSHYKFANLQRSGWFKVEVPAGQGYKRSSSSKIHVTKN